MALGFGNINNLFSGFGLSSRNTPGQTARAAGNFGNKKDKLGRPLAVRSSRTAENVFGFGQNYLDIMPQQKFLFYVKFMRHLDTAPSPTATASSAGTAADWSKGVGFVVKKIDRPSVNFHLETLNQYNKVRKVQLRREYGDVTITFHDTHDMRVRHMFEEYFKYHYGDPNRMTYMDWGYDQTLGQFRGGETGWGYRIHKEKEPNVSPFFSHIDIYQFSHGAYTITTLVNPYIISFDPDNLAYEEGSVGQEIQMKLGFEGIIMNSALTKLAPGDPLLQETMLDRADYYEPENFARARGTLPSPWIPSRQPAGPDFLGGMFKAATSAILSGNTKNLSKVVTNSALDSFGYFDFNGVNVGGVMGSARSGGVQGALGNILMSSDAPGAREVMTMPGGLGTGGSGSLGTTAAVLAGSAVLGGVLNSNSDPNMQGGNVYVSGANGTSEWINPDTGQNANSGIVWNSDRYVSNNPAQDISDMPWLQSPTQRAIGIENRMVEDERKFREDQGIDQTPRFRTAGFFGG